MNPDRRRFFWIGAMLVSAIALVAVGLALLNAFQPAALSWNQKSPSAAGGDSPLVGKRLPSFAAIQFWLDGDSVADDSLASHPLLVVTWNDTRPAGIAAARRAREWHEVYARYGLRVIGIHVPEFAFAADTAYVARARRRLGLEFPIGNDPSLQLASDLGWDRGPRLILADPGGVVRAEGDPARRMETEVRALLERFRPDLSFPDESPAGAIPPGAPAWSERTIHLGSARVRTGPLASARVGIPQMFTAQFRYQVEGQLWTPFPVGLWTASAEGVTANRGGAENYLALRYDAGPVAAVLSPPDMRPTRVWVLRDERWIPAAALGEDMRLDGRGASYVLVDTPRLYSLCREAPGAHVLKLSPETPGVTLHAMIFESATGPARP